MAPNRPSPQDEPTEEVEALSEEEVDGEEEEESRSEPESESKEPEPPNAAPTHVAEKKPDSATVPQSESESESAKPEPPKAAPTPVAEKKPPSKKPDSATVPQSESESESAEPEPPKAAPTHVAEKKPPPKKPDSATVPQSSSSGSEFESEEPLKKPDSAMEETPKTKKPRSKALATTRPAARAGSKRPSESDPKDSKSPKKKKISDSDPKKLFEKISIDDGEMTIQLQHKMRMLKKKAKGKKYKLLEGCLELIGEPKRTELKEEWKKLNVAELELVVRRGELAKLILEASKVKLCTCIARQEDRV